MQVDELAVGGLDYMWSLWSLLAGVHLWRFESNECITVNLISLATGFSRRRSRTIISCYRLGLGLEGVDVAL